MIQEKELHAYYFKMLKWNTKQKQLMVEREEIIGLKIF